MASRRACSWSKACASATLACVTSKRQPPRYSARVAPWRVSLKNETKFTARTPVRSANLKATARPCAAKAAASCACTFGAYSMLCCTRLYTGTPPALDAYTGSQCGSPNLRCFLALPRERQRECGRAKSKASRASLNGSNDPASGCSNQGRRSV